MTNDSPEAQAFDLAQLAREVAARLDPLSLMSLSDIGALTGYTAEYVTSSFVKADGFPAPLRLKKKGGVSHPRRRRRDILAWIAAHEDVQPKKKGRPRLSHGDDA